MFDRKKQLRWANLKVGLVVTLTLAIVFLVIVFSGGIQKIIQKTEYIRIAISDVKGLRKGAPVRVAGIDVGEVKEIRLSKDFGTIVTVSLNREILDFLKKDAKASVQTIGLLGDKYVEISPGNANEPFNKANIMEGYPQSEIRDIISVASSTLMRIDTLINNFDRLLADIKESKGTAYKFLKDPSLYDNLTSLIYQLKSATEEIRTGSLGMISRDKEMYYRLSASVKNLEELSNKIITSSGSLGKLINEPDLYENLTNSSKKLDKLISDIENSEGAFKLILKDRDTAEELKKTVKELRELIEEIRKNPKKFFKFSVF